MMGVKDEGASPLENRVLRARARGELSADAAFEALFQEYRRIVASWLAVRVDGGSVDDLAQDVWLIFYGRFRRWEFPRVRRGDRKAPGLGDRDGRCRSLSADSVPARSFGESEGALAGPAGVRGLGKVPPRPLSLRADREAPRSLTGVAGVAARSRDVSRRRRRAPSPKLPILEAPTTRVGRSDPRRSGSRTARSWGPG